VSFDVYPDLRDLRDGIESTEKRQPRYTDR
jgi:hypothetical protein